MENVASTLVGPSIPFHDDDDWNKREKREEGEDA